MNLPQVTVVVLNYARPKDTIECLHSLKLSKYSGFKLLVIDNASPDNSVDQIQMAHPDVEVIETPHNIGYSGGMNFGIRYAMQFSPDYLLLINSDTVVDEGFISTLIEVVEIYPRAAAASGTIYYSPEREKMWYAGGTIRYWRASGFTNHELLKDRESNINKIKKVSFLAGCAFLIRVSAIQQVGLFDERFFMYLEDTELCSRLLRKNYELLYVPSAKLYHKVNDERIRPFSLYFSVRNRLLFVKIAAKGFQKIIGYFYLFIVCSVKILYWSLTSPSLAKAITVGIRDFFAGRFYEGSGFRFLNKG